MRTLFCFCAICCFIAIFGLPISYYTFLRVLITIGAISMIYHLSLPRYKNHGWIAVFAIILVLFNPIYPFYFYKKAIWIPLDVITGILFLVFAFVNKKEMIRKEKTVEPINTKKPYTRDRIIIPKNTTLKDN